MKQTQTKDCRDENLDVAPFLGQGTRCIEHPLGGSYDEARLHVPNREQAFQKSLIHSFCWLEDYVLFVEFYSLYRGNVQKGFVGTFFIFLTSVCWGWLLLCEHLAHGAGAIFCKGVRVMLMGWCMLTSRDKNLLWMSLSPSNPWVTGSSMWWWSQYDRRGSGGFYGICGYGYMTLWACLKLYIWGHYNAARDPIPSTIGPWFRSSGSPCRHFGVNDFEPSPLLSILLVIS